MSGDSQDLEERGMATWLGERALSYSRACLLTAIALSPLIFNTSTVDVFGIVKLTTIWTFVVGGLGLWLCFHLYTGAKAPRSILLVIAACFLAVCVLATVFSELPVPAFAGDYHRYMGLVSLLLYLGAMFLVTALYWRQPEDLWQVCAAAVAASCAMSLYQWIQALGLDWNTWTNFNTPEVRGPGTLGNSNFTGGYLGAALPYTLFLLANPKSIGRRYLWGVLALHLSALWLTGARAGLLAAGASLMVFLALYPLGRTPSARRRQRTLLLVPLLIGGVAFVVWSASSDRGASTLLVRADFWRTAVRIVADHPLLGTGPDTFYAFYPTYRPVESALVYTGVESSAHNLLLHHAVGSGLLGAGLFLVLIGMAFLFALRGPRQPSKAEAGEDQTNGPGSALRPRLLATFSAVLAGYLVQGMFSVDLPPLALVGWVAMGGIAALADPKLAGQPAGLPVDHGPGKPTKVNAGSRRSTRRTGSALLAGLMALLILVGIRPFLADMRARSAVSSSDLQERVSLFRQAQELNPLEGEYHYMAGRTLWRFGANARDDNSKRQLYDAALSQHRRADDLRPRQVRYLVEIARLESAVAQELDAARFSSADRAWQAVTRLDPTDYRWHKMRARLLGAWADATGNNQQVRQAQITELRRSIQIARGQPDAWARLVLALRALGRPDEAAEVQGSFFGPGMADVQLQSLVQDDPVPPVPSAPPAEPDRPAARFGLAAVVAAAGVFLWLLLSRLVGASLDGQEARRAVPRTPLFELVAAAGVLSAAVASPYLAPLLGLESTDVERRELVLHLIPAVALVALGIWCAGSNRIRPAAFRRAVAALFVAAALSVVPHVPALLDGGQSDIARGLLHVAPGLLVLALLTQARLPVEPRRSDAARLAVDQ